MTRHQLTSRIIAFAGPKGGCGRSTCTVSLARALASRDRRVLIVDNNGFAGGLAPLVDLPRQNVQDAYHFKPASTPNPNLDLVTIAPVRDSIDELFDHWRKTYEYDDIIIDLRSGFGAEPCDLFIHADIPVLIVNAEPATIQLATIWLRQVMIRHIEAHHEFGDLISHFSDCRDTWTFSSVYDNLPPLLQQQFISSIDTFRCALLFNHLRENSEELQGMALCHAFGVCLGANIEWLGSLSFDDRRWFFSRRLADVSLFNREDPMVREWDTLAREKFHDDLFKKRPCLPLLNPQSNPRQYLLVETAEEARKSYRLLWEGYRRENGLVTCLFPANEIVKIIANLEIAYRNADVEPSVMQVSSPEQNSPERSVVTRLFSDTFAAVKSYDPAACSPNAGLWLQTKRKNAGLSVAQLALKTRIPKKVIENLEKCDLAQLSAVRLQAYLFEIARAIEIDLDELRHQFGL